MLELRRGGGRDERQGDLQRLGIGPEMAQAWLEAQDETAPSTDGAEADTPPGAALSIWPENWPCLGAWMRLQTQWHLGPSGRMAGLRYPEAERQVQRLMPGASQAELDTVMGHLQQMEHAALEALDGQQN